MMQAGRLNTRCTLQACFSAERAHHEAIGAIASIEALQAYDVTAGWPATDFQE